MAIERIVDVVAGVLVENGRVLLAQRGADDSLANLWEFPGGKVEDGETHEQALVREFVEELSIDIAVGQLIVQSRVRKDAYVLQMTSYLVTRIAGEPKSLVHQDMRWVEIGVSRTYPMPEADLEVIAWLETQFG